MATVNTNEFAHNNVFFVSLENGKMAVGSIGQKYLDITGQMDSDVPVTFACNAGEGHNDITNSINAINLILSGIAASGAKNNSYKISCLGQAGFLVQHVIAVANGRSNELVLATNKYYAEKCSEAEKKTIYSFLQSSLHILKAVVAQNKNTIKFCSETGSWGLNRLSNLPSIILKNKTIDFSGGVGTMKFTKKDGSVCTWRNIFTDFPVTDGARSISLRRCGVTKDGKPNYIFYVSSPNQAKIFEDGTKVLTALSTALGRKPKEERIFTSATDDEALAALLSC